MASFEELQEVVLKAVRAGMNILIEGPHGSGKTALARAVAAASELELKYFSAPTLDPFADLVGIPVPVVEPEGRRIVFLRPDAVNTAQILFFDELNRAHPKVLNAVFELIQFRSINGEPLPRLRAVIAVINPASTGYQVQELDRSLLDRFHLHLVYAEGPDRRWFKGQFDEPLASGLLDWWYTDLDKAQKGQVSNRRLEYLGRLSRQGIDPRFGLPPGTTLPLASLAVRLAQDHGLPRIEDFLADPARSQAQVSGDIAVAMRFVDLWPTMPPAVKARLKEVVLALPAEALAAAQAKYPFVIKATIDAVTRAQGKAESAAFKQLLEERLRRARGDGPPPPPKQ